MNLESFLNRWLASGAAERANYQLFLTQLCELLEVPQPEPTRDRVAENAYVFERDVTFDEADGTHSIGRIDLYKRGCFVLEAKQGSDAQADTETAQQASLGSEKQKKKKGTAVRGSRAWDDAMIRARGQADRYARALPASEGWPPFLIVVDVGHSIELYSDFTRSGKVYVPFPDPVSHRLRLDDLRDEKIRERLRLAWTDPLALDPSRRAAKVTRELAQRLAELAKLLEQQRHDPALVAKFLMRCLFTMFAEDVELIPRGAFTALLTSLRDDPAGFQPMVETLWREMNTGIAYSTILRKHLLQFNGGLFAEPAALPLTQPMLQLLIEAAAADWTDVEPAIFGTLLERALDPIDRHKLGAHYTPRAYVERLVMPTIIEPLREQWGTVYATALMQARAGELPEAQTLVREFHHQLCETRVLDPACGSANFLYVTPEHMKRLEGEVLNTLRELGDEQKVLLEVDPHQFLGIEINPRAAAIAELVLWIGYLQWHFRTRGKAQPAEPIIKNYKNIECRDAVLAWDRTEPLLDDSGHPVTRWDGRTMKRHSVTGELVPDDTARTAVLKYINPRKAEWPKADYVVGNPPFVGNKRMVFNLGSGYVDALRRAHSQVPESADLVMYWWDRAASSVADSDLHQFGLITTNSITQTFNRTIVQRHLDVNNSVALRFAIADHPWVTSEDGAAVRIAMTVGAKANSSRATLIRVAHENESTNEVFDARALTLVDELVERIHSDLTSAADVTKCRPLISNLGLTNQGVTPLGEGFRLKGDDLAELGIDRFRLPPVVKRYAIGRDIMQIPEEKYIIDFFGLDQEVARSSYPELMQIVVDRVRPEREQKNRPSYRSKWWIFAEPRANLRPAISTQTRYIATCRTAKHRVFVFLESTILPDAKIVAIALQDAFFLGVSSSRAHVTWAILTGGWLGVGNDSNYNHSECFGKFPFPDCSDELKARIRDLGEQLDAHRKRQQAAHPQLTLTDMYNVLEKLRAGEELNAKDKRVHEEGLVSVLKEIHDRLDAAVFEAYGWPSTLSDEEILERLVALNAERAAEEARGLVRWLRPEFQCPALSTESGARVVQTSLAMPEEADSGKPVPAENGTAATGKKPAWPKGRAERTKAIQAALAAASVPLTSDELAKQFSRARGEAVAEILEALSALGLARRVRGGKYVASS